MDLLKKKPFHYSVIISLVGVVFLAVTALYLSGTLGSITTTLIKPKASSLLPSITRNFIDNFKDASIDESKWQKSAPGNVSIGETTADNLRMNIPEGSIDGKVKQGQLIYKDVLKDNADFRVDAVVFRPIVTGAGTGITGMRFSSMGASDKEGAVVRWMVNGSSSIVQFVVTDKDGNIKVSASQNLVSPNAILRLVRVNKEYRAMFKAGTDYSSDLNWTSLGVCDETAATNNCASTLGGQDGKLALFTHNGGIGKLFPKVVGRFDQTRIGTETDPTSGTPSPRPSPANVSFSDAFSNGNLGINWIEAKSTGVTITETGADNLRIDIPTGAVNNTRAFGYIRRKTPTIGVEKNFTYTTTLFKPAVTGDGTGWAGLSFGSTSAADKESASVRYIVKRSGTTVTSRLAFFVNDRNGGTPIERTSVSFNKAKVSIRLRRFANKYTAWYRIGDADADWAQIGTLAAAETLGADGFFLLNSSNGGVSGKFPAVVGRFDGASATIER